MMSLIPPSPSWTVRVRSTWVPASASELRLSRGLTSRLTPT